MPSECATGNIDIGRDSDNSHCCFALVLFVLSWVKKFKTRVYKYYKMAIPSNDEMCCTLATLILMDDDVPVTVSCIMLVTLFAIFPSPCLELRLESVL